MQSYILVLILSVHRVHYYYVMLHNDESFSDSSHYCISEIVLEFKYKNIDKSLIIKALTNLRSIHFYFTHSRLLMWSNVMIIDIPDSTFSHMKYYILLIKMDFQMYTHEE